MKDRIKKHWFLLALSCSFAIGFLGANPVQRLSDVSGVRSGLVFAVMWMMGLTLRPGTLVSSWRQPAPSILAIVINVLLVPVLCLPLFAVLPAEFSGGLFVAALVPCTLASASVWTRKAGGDDSIAMITTVITNLGCVLVVPVGVGLVLALETEISAWDRMLKLGGIVVAPLLLAQIMRSRGIAKWADHNKPRLSLIAQWGILVMVSFGAASSRIRIDQSDGQVDLLAVVMVVAASALVHTIALASGVFVAKKVGCGKPQQIAVGIAGSQKTLMVGLQVAIDCGVSVIPMLVYHVSQLIIDTIIAHHWHSKLEPQNEPKPKDRG